ncbi:diguanylate cyclase with PAS/PAC and GAF sensors [Nostoc sp. NIES-2111]|nr:diguanylate cyclase with PAS/PAC and GAF sensors [Nostoc sp. NIES-2111]
MLFNCLSNDEIDLKQILYQIRMITMQIHHSSQLSEILKVIVNEVRKMLKSDRVVIYRFLPDGEGVVAEESVNPKWISIQEQLVYNPYFQADLIKQYQAGQVDIIEDINAQPLAPIYKQLLTKLQVRAKLVVPIVVDDQAVDGNYSSSSHLWGLLIVHQCSSPRQWYSLEVEFLQLLAVEIEIFIQQSQKYEKFWQLHQKRRHKFRLARINSRKNIRETAFANQQESICPTLCHVPSALCPLASTTCSVPTVTSNKIAIADLMAFDRLQTPIWIYDIENSRMWWVNQAALHIWNAQSREEILKRNFSNVSESTRIRLQSYIHQFQQGKIIAENWTFYPEGQPVSVRCLCSGVQIEDGRMAMLVEGTTQVTEEIDQEILRAIEGLSHTTLMISLYTTDGVPLMQNPAAFDCYEDTLHPSAGENAFLRHFVDPNIGLQALSVINLGEFFRVETQVFTKAGIRWHEIDVRCPQDPVTGNKMILVNEKDITKEQIALLERQLAQEELRWQEALLRSMTDSSLLAFFVVDNRTDEILYFNQRFCEIWDIEHLEARMRLGELKNNDIIPDCVSLIAGVPAFAESCKPLQSQDNRCIIEDEILFVDGRTIRRFSNQIRDSRDKYFGRLYIFEDITSRKQIEAALKASEERWQYALEGNGDGVWDWNAQTNTVFFSRRWKQMLGFEEDEIGNTLNEWDERVHPDDKAQVYEEIEKHFRGEAQQYISEHRVLCKDGTYKWILDRGKIFSRGDNGSPLRLLGTHTDITDRKRMEEALRESEERYHSVITAMTEGIVLQQADGCITACNESAQRILGLTPEQMMGRTSIDKRWQAIHEDGSPFLGQTHPAVVTLQTGQPQYNVIMGVHKPDDSLSWILINSQPLFQPDQAKPYAVVASFTDITASKQAGLALKQQMEQERVVYAISQHIRQTLDLDKILQTTVTEVRNFLQSDRVIIYRFNPDWSAVVITESVAEPWRPILNMKITESNFIETKGKLSGQSTVEITPNIYNAGFAPYHVEFLEQLQVKAKLVLPILHKSNLWGLLVVHHCCAFREWQPTEIQLLQQIATQTAIAIQQSELHQRLQTANRELKNLAMVDQLTGIANRRRFDQKLDCVWRHFLREQGSVSLLLCDIDYFKRYNDTYGHAAGDDCLRLVAAAFQQTVKRSTDLPARYGGEEFVVILPNTDTEGAWQVAQEIHQAVQQLNIPHSASDVKPYVTLSIGIATVIPNSTLTPLNLIEAADQALYQAKAQGRDRAFINEEGERGKGKGEREPHI